MGVASKLVLATLPFVPTPIMRRMSARYIAGETLGEALRRLRELAQRGFPGILDILGEDVRDAAHGRLAQAAYLEGVEALQREKLDAYASVKPTHFGLRLSEDLAHELYTGLLQRCREYGQFARIEMEDHTTTDAILRLFRRLVEDGFDNVGIVLQSRLLRTPADIEGLPAVPVDVRLVKGIYLEPASIAHVEAEAIRDAYVQAAMSLLAGGHRVALATHDEGMATTVLAEAARLGFAREKYEFEVLMGVQEGLWNRWRAAGERVRVYVPYGAEWRAYSTRRLKKNPQILGYVLRSFLPG
jgi:proline dehydrogenase